MKVQAQLWLIFFSPFLLALGCDEPRKKDSDPFLGQVVKIVRIDVADNGTRNVTFEDKNGKRGGTYVWHYEQLPLVDEYWTITEAMGGPHYKFGERRPGF